MTQDDGQHAARADAADAAVDGVADATSGPLAGLRILVVDDSRTVRRSAAGHLERAGAEVALADDGFAALAALVDVRPHALVADIVMPRLDGYQVCALVRANAEFGETPVLLLSSRDGLFDRARGNLAGASGHLAKPVDGEELVRCIAELVER